MGIKESVKVWLMDMGMEEGSVENNLAVELLPWICGAEIVGSG